jgi:hypothetical protein
MRLCWEPVQWSIETLVAAARRDYGQHLPPALGGPGEELQLKAAKLQVSALSGSLERRKSVLGEMSCVQ